MSNPYEVTPELHNALTSDLMEMLSKYGQAGASTDQVLLVLTSVVVGTALGNKYTPEMIHSLVDSWIQDGPNIGQLRKVQVKRNQA